MENNEVLELEGKTFEPFTLICDILRNWWIILLGAIGAALMTNVIMSARYEPAYSTSATFVVSMKNSANSGNYWSKSYEMAQTMQLVLQSNSMNRIICEELGVDSVDAEITAKTLGSTNLLELRVTAESSREAIDVMHVVMDNYSKVSFYALGATMMEVLEEPAVPMYPSNSANINGPVKKAFLAMGLALTVLFGLLSYFQDTLKKEQDIEKKLDVRSLGQIPFEIKYKTLKELIKHKKSALLVNNPVAGFRFVESYKKLASKVDYRMKQKGNNAIVVTSIAENEGKSTVAANLAISLAGQSKRVILIEGDLRRPSQFLIMEKQPKENQEVGEFLLGKTGLEDILQKSEIPNLYLILGRNCYSSSTEMVQTAKMNALLEQCKQAADYVIIDSPPVGLIGDAEVLARSAGSVMLVAKQNYLPVEDLNDVLDGFRAQNCSVLGVVLNGVLTVSDIVDSGVRGRYGGYGRYAEVKKTEGIVKDE